MEIVIAILLRLPVKSVLRFKLVCKSWLHLISSPNFIKSHAIMANNKLTRIGVFDPFPTIHQFQRLKSLVDHEEEEELIDAAGDKFHFAHENYIVIPSIVGSYRVIGSCNGIVCLWNRFSKIVYLWNPSIKKWKGLPQLIGTQVDILGFGFDSVLDHFKVLGIDFPAEGGPILKVYSTGSDCWKELIMTFPNIRIDSCYLGSSVVANCVLYVYDCAGWFIWFDLHKEDFGLVPNHPRFCFESSLSNVLDYEGSAAMIFESFSHGTGLHLWTLEFEGDGSGNVIWTKRFAIQPNELRFTCYLGGGQFYGYRFLSDDFFYHYLYDSKKGKTKLCGGGEESIKHAETLVSLDGFQSIESIVDSISL